MGKAWGVMHGAVMRRLSQAPPVKAYVIVLASPDSGADMLATDDKMISRLTIRRIHDRGDFVGIAPTGEEYEATGIVIHRIAGGRIAEEWSEGSGILGLTQQRLEQEIREREHVEQELLVARRIQQASLPKEVPTLEGWEISPHYQPAREVGGDFYDFFELEGASLAS
ncbi:MAG TPA: ester cyclase [Rubrobacter sp.]|nr:ester cyclase [Rubrobacter sp.]